MPKLTREQQALAQLKRWRSDPVAFMREVLGFEPWAAPDGRGSQVELARAVCESNYIACRSGHKCGKTTICAAIALWWVTCHERSRVVFTAPAAPQIERGLWAELDRLYRNARVPLGGQLNETPWTGLKFADGRDVFGRTTKRKENFAGISAPKLLIIVDEASGIDEDIFEAIFGNLGGGGTLLMISNPTQLAGRFYEAFHSKRDNWRLVHISSEDTPNFHGGKVEGLAEPGWARMLAKEYGRPSAHYDVRVLGNFPSQADNAVIGFGLVEASLRRRELLDAIAAGTLTPTQRAELKETRELDQFEALVFPTAPLTIGVDVARFGDDTTVFTPVRGKRMDAPKDLHALDAVDVAGHAHAFARGLALSSETPTCRVDANGLGAGVHDHLRRREYVKSIAINVSERATDETRYRLLRDELWFGMREWLASGGILPNHPRLAAELISPTYSFDEKGRYVVESKKDIKERLGRSPDFADSACLAVSTRAPGKLGLRQLRELRRGRCY